MVPMAAILLLPLLAGIRQSNATPSRRLVQEGQAAPAPSLTNPSQWLNWGNTRPERNHRKGGGSALTRATVRNLQELFAKDVNSRVSATPAVVDGVLYFPDWSGYMWAIDGRTGATIWRQFLASLLPPSAEVGPGGLMSRNSPAVDLQRGIMVFGTRMINSTFSGWHAFVMALRLKDGTLAWANTEAATYHPYTIFTQSPSIWEDSIFIGVSSREDLAAEKPEYPCCTFQGSMLRLNLDTGALVWQTWTQPAPHPPNNPVDGFSGGSIWGSAPVIDEARHLVYVPVGNNYRVPPDAQACLNNEDATPEERAACVNRPDNWFDAVIALDITTGAIRWGVRAEPFDVWTGSCVTQTGNHCYVPASPDYDFAQAPLYFPGVQCARGGATVTLDLLVAAQKSGDVHAWDLNTATNGNPPQALWPRVFTGAGSFIGGAEWGSCSDGSTTFFAPNTNGNYLEVNLVNPAPGSMHMTRGGFLTAIDICTGAIRWQTAAPNAAQVRGAPAFGGNSVNDGVVCMPTMNPRSIPTGAAMYCFDAMAGELLRQFPLGADSAAGPAIVDGTIYVGEGYPALPAPGRQGRLFHAYSTQTPGSPSPSPSPSASPPVPSPSPPTSPSEPITATVSASATATATASATITIPS